MISLITHQLLLGTNALWVLQQRCGLKWLFSSKLLIRRREVSMTIVLGSDAIKRQLLIISRRRAVISVWFLTNIKSPGRFPPGMYSALSSLAKRRSLFMWSEWHSHPALCVIHWGLHNMTGLVSIGELREKRKESGARRESLFWASDRKISPEWKWASTIFLFFASLCFF